MKTIVVAVIILLSINISLGQDVEVPVDQQCSLFLKILSFDKNLKDRAGNEIVLSIFYQGNFKISLDVKDNLMNAFDKLPAKDVQNIPVKLVAIDLDKVGDPSDILKKNNISVLYVAPLRAAHLSSIINLAHSQQIRTLTGVPDYVSSGLALGIGSRGGKPLILVNLSAAKAEGANYNSQLLKLAKIVG